MPEHLPAQHGEGVHQQVGEEVELELEDDRVGRPARVLSGSGGLVPVSEKCFIYLVQCSSVHMNSFSALVRNEIALHNSYFA